MTQSITLELPDQLYQKFKLRSQQTNRSVEEELLTAFALDLPVLPMAETGALKAYNEVMDFLSRGPAPVEIVQFQLSEEARQRARELLIKEREDSLTASESQELDFYVELGDFSGILRAKAQVQLQANGHA
jgi:hypothetical protein